MNIKWIGGLYKSDIEIFLNTQQEDRSALFEKIFGSTFRFLCEFNLNVPGEIYETRSAFKFVGNNLDKFENTLRQELTFAMFAMPVSIIREILNQPEVKDLRDLASTVARSEKLKKEWDDSLDQRTRRLEGLADNIKKITSQYNFVGI